MVLLIIIGIGLVTGTLIGFYVWRTDRYASFLSVFGGVFFGAMGGTFIGLLVAVVGSGISAQDKPYENVETYELVALATQQETEGSGGMLIFVGWGQVGEVRKAYWTAKDEDGIAQMYSDNAEYILVKETNETPRYVIQAQIDDSGIWFPSTTSYNVRQYLEVPEGTMTANYEFQP